MGEGFRGFGGRGQGGLVAVLTLLVAAWIVLAWPWISGHSAVPWDAKAHFLPQLQFLAHTLANGESPYWTPDVFSGHAQIADPQSLIFSPPFFLLAYFNAAPTSWVQDTTVFVVILFSMAAMVAWLTDKNWHPAACLLSALSFGFGAAMSWRVQHLGQVVSLAYLPIILLCLDRAIGRGSVIWGVLAGVSATSLVLGRDQVALLAVYFLAAYVPWRLFTSENVQKTLRYSFLPIGAAALTGAALIAVPVILTLLTAAESNRPSIDFIGAGRGSLHPALFLTLLSADVFGASGKFGDYWGPPSAHWPGLDLYIAQNMGVMYAGAMTACLCIWGLFGGLAWKREIRLFSIALLLTCLYGLGWYTPIFKIMHSILPGVDLYRRPADAVFNIGLYFSIIAGHALNSLLKAESLTYSAWKAAYLAAVPLTAFAIMLGLASHFAMIDAAKVPLLTSGAVLLVAAAGLALLPTLNRRSPLAVTALVAAATAADLAYFNGPNGATALPPATFEVLDPNTKNETIEILKQKVVAGSSSTRRDRVELVGFGFHWPNVSLTHGLENTLGYNPVRSALYSNATGAGDHVGLPEQKNFSKLFPSYRSLLADLLGLRYIATSVPIEEIDRSIRPGDLTLAAKTKDGYIYENPRALPRVMLASRSLPANFANILATGAWPDFNPEAAVLLEKPSAMIEGHGGRVMIEAYHNTSVTIYADSPDGGYVVLNDLWHPWWVARVDGIRRPLERANVLFRAVAIPAGKHRIVMTFEPFTEALAKLKRLMWGNT